MSYVQSGTPIQEASGSTSRSPSITGVTPGSLLVLFCAWGSTGSSDTGPDLTSQGWTLVATVPTNTSHSFSLYASIYYKANAASGTHTASITLSAADSQGEWLISEFAGYGTSPTVNAFGTNRWGVGGDVTTGTVSTSAATTVANTLVCVVMSHDDASGVSDNHLTTPTSGYTSLFGNSNSITYNPCQFAYKEVTSTGTQSATIGSPTALTAGWGSGVIVAFAGSASGAISADSKASSSTTGALTTAITMAAASVAKAATAATLTTGLVFGAASQATSSSTASLTTQISIAASSKASASSTASLTTGPILAASSQASSSSTAALTTQIPLVAASKASASSSASLTVGSVPASIVSATDIKQVWQSGTNWSAANVSVTQSGDAILTFMFAYVDGTLGQHYPCTDNHGTFTAAVDTGRPDPGSYPSYPQPVISNIYYELNAAVTTHTITPPDIGLAEGFDGNIWAVVVRGLPTTGAPRCTGHFHQVSNSAGTTYSSVSVSLDTSCQIGDLIFAVLGYDDDRPFGVVTLTDPSGWTPIAHETDAATNCPAGVYWKIATAADTETVSLSWNDPHATVTDASIMAFAPATPQVLFQASSTAQASTTATLTTGIPIVSASTASASTTANLTTQIQIAAVSKASASSTASLSTGNAIFADSRASSSSSATLTTSIQMAASSGATAGSTSSLTTAIPLVAASAAQSSSTAQLTAGNFWAADASAKSSTTAELTTQISIAAQSSCNASTRATLTVANASALVATAQNTYIGRKRIRTLS